MIEFHILKMNSLGLKKQISEKTVELLVLKNTKNKTTSSHTLWMSFFLLAATTLVNGVIGDEVRITSVDEFIQFKDNVSKGTNYAGTTVFLDSDVDFTGKSFEPIGNKTYHFSGVFDGQGYVISDLIMNSSSQYTGLFGYSEGLTIKNVILDESCSIASSFNGSGAAYIGGIIGFCSGPCIIENNVNMGSVSFNVDISDNSLVLGGIVGYIYSPYGYDSTVKNCANYGPVAHPGSSHYSYVGGIVGFSDSWTSSEVYIYNCLNHGTITHKGATSYDLRLGGIAGNTAFTTIENCASGGKILLLGTASNYNRTGSIVGYIPYFTFVNYTYFTSDLGGHKKYGEGTPSESNTFSYDNTTFELNGTVSIGTYSGTSLIGALNAYSDNYTLRDYSHWLLNKGNNAVSFTINGKSAFAMNSQVILLPSLASEGNTSFDGWYEDSWLTTPLTEFEVTSDTELYGSFCSPSNFTVTLDVNGGGELQYNPAAVVCNDIYVALPMPTRTGYTFIGWFDERNESVTEESIVKILDNHTLYAHWLVITPSQVEIVFSKKGMTNEEIEEIVKKYTKAEFTITVMKSITDEIRVIVEFVDVREAEEFVRNVDAAPGSDRESDSIKSVDFVQRDAGSFSPAHLPMSLLYLI